MLEIVEFKYGKNIKHRVGGKAINAYIDAVHAFPPTSDDYTNFIVEGVIRNTNCSGLVAITSRTIADLNRPINPQNQEAVLEYRAAITEIVTRLELLDDNNEIQRPYLHIAVHGMKDRPNKDIEIGTRNGELCNSKVKSWFIDKMREKMDYRIVVDDVFVGDKSLSFHRYGDPSSINYKGFGENYNIFQVEISKQLRDNHLGKLIDMFSSIIEDFKQEF